MGDGDRGRRGSRARAAPAAAPEPHRGAHPHGADIVLEAESGSLADQILDVTEGRGADVIVDHVGGDSLPESVQALALGGRLISVGRLGGGAGTLDLELLAFKRARVIGVTFRTRTLEEHASIVRGVAWDLLPAMGGGALRPIVDRVYPLSDVTAAHARMAAGEHRGKLVVGGGARAHGRRRASRKAGRRRGVGAGSGLG